MQSTPTRTRRTGLTGGSFGANTAFTQYCSAGQAGCAAAGGTNYGNSYTWNTGTGGTGPSVTATAWGSQSYGGTTAESAIQKAWIGNYDPNGLGITSQSGTGNAELTAAHQPDASSPQYQHAIDNVGSYESMLFSFGSAVALNSVSIGFKGTDADATVFVYAGAGDPAAALAGQTYAQLLGAYNSTTHTGGWVLAGNILDMSVGANSFTNTSAVSSSKYWMVGAYAAVGGNTSGNVGNDAFKISGLGASTVTTGQAVPEPDSSHCSVSRLSGCSWRAARHAPRLNVSGWVANYPASAGFFFMGVARLAPTLNRSTGRGAGDRRRCRR